MRFNNVHISCVNIKVSVEWFINQSQLQFMNLLKGEIHNSVMHNIDRKLFYMICIINMQHWNTKFQFHILQCLMMQIFEIRSCASYLWNDIINNFAFNFWSYGLRVNEKFNHIMSRYIPNWLCHYSNVINFTFSDVVVS